MFSSVAALRNTTTRRFFSIVPTLRQAAASTTTTTTTTTTTGKPTSTTNEVPLNTDYKDIPGFREPGELASNYEIAVGKERFEHLSKLQGKDPWDNMKPIILTHKGTKENPIQVSGVDPVFYVGCTGFPAGSHETVFLTLKDKKTVDRCPHCGQAFKYTQLHDEHH